MGIFIIALFTIWVGLFLLLAEGYGIFARRKHRREHADWVKGLQEKFGKDE